MSIKDNLINLKNKLPSTTKLVAVSKTKPIEDIMEAYDAGQRVFGENKAQDMASKHALLPEDIEWHFIGHMQTNKVKLIAPFVSLIHSVDSLKLAKEINKQAEKNNRTIDCLLQFHIADEETKFGLSYNEAIDIIQNKATNNMDNIRFVGVMGMATFTDDNIQIKTEFGNLLKSFNKLKATCYSTCDYFEEISMGMSADYKIALEEGSTIIRLGTLIFGERNHI